MNKKNNKTLSSLVLILSTGVGLSACNITQETSDIDKQTTLSVNTESEHVLLDCYASESSTSESESFKQSIDCEPPTEGVIEVVHPVTEIDETLSSTLQPSKDDASANDDEVQYSNLWFYIADQLEFDVPEGQRRISVQKNWYLKHPNYMQRVSNRAAPFLYYIVKRLDEENMPLDIALLPIVESAFDPFAYSHGRAAGMWQFIPGTGKNYGMKQTWWYDGRRDVIASTDGAIAYLKRLHKMFDGDWLHALAAYNSGEGRVMRAIRKNKRAGKAIDFWSLDLPRETRAYVPKLLALTDILRNLDTNQFAWPTIANAPVLEIVDVNAQIDLSKAANMAGLTTAELQALNPGFNRWATDPEGPHTLLLPIQQVEQFKLALANTSENEMLNWVRYKIRSGDSLEKIAKKYNTTTDVIKEINDLRSSRIYAGKHLLVPVALKSIEEYALSVDQRLLKTQSIARGSHKTNHKVRNGDTLWDIARKHKVSVRDLAKWNKMAPRDPLKIGMNLVVWTGKPDLSSTQKSINRNITYRVKSGDSLSRIAQRFKLKINDIVQWNNLQGKKYLQPGQKLKLTIDVTKT
ncbi:LysM peptidoglycan-binding domain-containing protein [Agaribacter flavus]|uniref:LysM peptidoglycan-binding domain-containing protein n=1 Tax=Agaribacter flavus TaxID=1902781 RepID=A0ABV7FMY8_9ALTE